MEPCCASCRARPQSWGRRRRGRGGCATSSPPRSSRTPPSGRTPPPSSRTRLCSSRPAASSLRRCARCWRAGGRRGTRPRLWSRRCRWTSSSSRRTCGRRAKQKTRPSSRRRPASRRPSSSRGPPTQPPARGRRSCARCTCSQLGRARRRALGGLGASRALTTQGGRSPERPPPRTRRGPACRGPSSCRRRPSLTRLGAAAAATRKAPGWCRGRSPRGRALRGRPGRRRRRQPPRRTRRSLWTTSYRWRPAGRSSCATCGTATSSATSFRCRRSRRCRAGTWCLRSRTAAVLSCGGASTSRRARLLLSPQASRCPLSS
mmetsp:Transcript_12186/g.36010  ORF Transcript_12186/g.36010 Transcript_12186/m.36010 type:complete len:318 (+) Transcript_12186:227-1180(+)